MDKLRPERVTQNRVIKLFQSLGYTYLGNWKTRERNKAIEYDLLEAFLKRRGFSQPQIGAARLKIELGSGLIN